MSAMRRPVPEVLHRLGCVLLPVALLLPLTYLLPPIELNGPLALTAFWVAESGGIMGIPLLGTALILLLVTRPHLSRRQRWSETLVLLVVLLITLGGGASLNEHVIKPSFAVPRPNIRELASHPPEDPALGMSVRQFYALPDKATRSDHLDRILTPDIPLHERVRTHWIVETGYSFPSGHSFSSLLFATYFLALALSCLSGIRLALHYLLLPWALAVCYSRPLLRVHTPTDVCLGGLEGILAGMLAFLLVRWLLAFLDPTEARLSR